MENTKTRRFIALMLISGFLFLLLTESCNSEKKCGCGVDLGSLYKIKKKHR